MEGGRGPSVSLDLGRCDEVRAEVFLRAEPADTAAGANTGTLTGTLTGPQRGRDTTLPATARLGPTATPGVARAIVTEPAYWSPDLPNLYRLRATVEAPGGPPCAIDRLVGLRRLGVRGRSLWLDGRRWVPRGCPVDGVAALDACKAAALAAVVVEPDDALLSRADQIGVAVLARVSVSAAGDAAAVAKRVAAWASHPSAVAVILPLGIPPATRDDVAAAAAARKGTLLVAATVAGSQPPAAVACAGIDALVVALDRDEVPHAAWRDGCDLPLIAWRRDGVEPAAGRVPCDALQAALAAWAVAAGRDRLTWDWAAYLVGDDRDAARR